MAASTVAVFIGWGKSFAYKSSLPEMDCQPLSLAAGESVGLSTHIASVVI
jgi:hypothetical protein